MANIRQELHLTFRQLRRSPVFSLTALLTLCLCISANVVMFAVVRNVLLRMPDYAAPGQLMVVRETIQGSELGENLPVNANHLVYWQQHARSFVGFAAIAPVSMPLGGGSQPEQIGVALHTANLFTLLGVQPQLGRSLLPQEEQPGHSVVLLSDALWRRSFGADPAILGRSIPLDGRPYTVVGVLPPGFKLPAPASMGIEAYVPFGWSAEQLGEVEGDHNYFGIARLKPGSSLQQATAEINAMQQAIGARTPDHLHLSATLTPLQQYLTGSSRRSLLLLLAAVMTLLLIGCVNITNLLLARASSREHEAAVRTALGASSLQLLRSSMAEPLLLCAAGCALGLGVATVALPWLAHLLPTGLPLLHPLRIDALTVGLAVMVSLVCGLLCGVLPALRFIHVAPNGALRAEGRTASESGGGKRLRRGLVMAEVTGSVTLVVVAGMFLLSMAHLLHVDRGFVTDHVASASVILPEQQYKTAAAREAFYRAALERLRQLPGTRSAGVVSVLPLDGDRWNDILSVPGDPRPLFSRPDASFRWTSSGYLETLRVPLLAGRLFNDADLGRNVAIVSRRAAQAAWPGQSALGKFFRRGDPDSKPFQVIGIVADVRALDLGKAPPAMVYVPLTFRSDRTASFVLRTSSDPAAMGDAIRHAIWSEDATVPVSEVRTMDTVVADSVAARSFQLHVLVAFAAGALVLAALGIYGVVAYTAMQRTRELGIRIALGARAGQIYALVLAEGVTPVFLGTLIGVVVSALVMRAISGLLFDVGEFNPAIAAAAAGILLIVGGLASLLPARRATHIDPVAALRSE